jgi:hypothetical protein
MEWNRKDGGGEVDEPVGEERADTNEDEIVPKIGAILLDCIPKRLEASGSTLLNDPSTNQVAQKVCTRGTTSRKLEFK